MVLSLVARHQACLHDNTCHLASFESHWHALGKVAHALSCGMRKSLQEQTVGTGHPLSAPDPQQQLGGTLLRVPPRAHSSGANSFPAGMLLRSDHKQPRLLERYKTQTYLRIYRKGKGTGASFTSNRGLASESKSDGKRRLGEEEGRQVGLDRIKGFRTIPECAAASNCLFAFGRPEGKCGLSGTR